MFHNLSRLWLIQRFYHFSCQWIKKYPIVILTWFLLFDRSPPPQSPDTILHHQESQWQYVQNRIGKLGTLRSCKTHIVNVEVVNNIWALNTHSKKLPQNSTKLKYLDLTCLIWNWNNNDNNNTYNNVFQFTEVLKLTWRYISIDV